MPKLDEDIEAMLGAVDEDEDLADMTFSEVQEVVDKAFKTGKTVFIDRRGYRKKAIGILRSIGNLRLVGETGTGKSTIVRHLCETENWEKFEYALTAETNRQDLLAQDILKAEKGGTSTEERLGIVARWLYGKDEDGKAVPENKPKCLFLDEFNYAEPNVMTLMNSLADFRKSVYIPELNKTLERTDKHYLVIGMNPSEKSQYTGTMAMNIAQLRRFESMRITYPDRDVELALIYHFHPKMSHKDAKQLVDFAIVSREMYMKGDLASPITTANLINYAKLMKEQDFGLMDIKDLTFAMMKEDELPKIEIYWQQSEKKVV